jgi:voltage-gated potassium channel
VAMTTNASGPATGDGPNSSRRKRARRGLVQTVLAVPKAIALPFVITGQALHQIWKSPDNRQILVVAIWLLAAGTLIFMIVERLSVIDAFYFSFITLATIGFGDIVPTTDLGKIVAVIYGIAGLGVLGALVSTISQQRLHKKRHEAASDSDPSAD